MPSSPNYKRNYKQERKTAIKRGETSVGSKSGDATRHRARRIIKAKLGEVVDHKVPLKSGGTNSKSNLRKRDKSSNSSHGGKIGNTRGKSNGGKKGSK